MMETVIVQMTVKDAEALATISELNETILAYERVLRRIERWGRDHEPSIWARQILKLNSRKLDS